MELKIIISQLIRMYKIEIELCKCYHEYTEGKYSYKYVLGKCKLTEITKYISENFLYMIHEHRSDKSQTGNHL